jgi:hypothetical protein
MVGKAKSIGHTSNAVDYGKEKEGSQEVSRNKLLGNSGYEIEQEFKVYQNLNSNTKLNTISVVLSPDPNDGRKLTNEEFKQITHSYLEKMNLQEHQHIAYVHRDRDHTHIHLYVNRIDDKGKAYNDSFIGKRTHHIADEIAKEKGLVSARDKMYQNSNREKLNLKELKKEIFKKHQEVMSDKPQSFDNYIKQMNLKGVDVKPTINKQGQLQGFRVTDRETKNNFKASEVNRSMSIGNLIKDGLKNDLDQQLNKPLDKAAKNQNLGIGREIKKTINPKPKNLGKGKDSKPLFKEKLSIKERLEFSKIEDNIIENFRIQEQNYWNELPKSDEKQIDRNLNKDNER